MGNKENRRRIVHQAVSGDVDGLVIQSGGSVTGVGRISGSAKNVVVQKADGVYVNGRKVSSGRTNSVSIVNGKITINGKPID